MGDAAHAVPPTLGQGGNQAIEDAIVLALRRPRPGPGKGTGTSVIDGLAAYTADRLPRTTAITRQAVRAARLTMMTGRVPIAVRNASITAVSKAAPALLLRGFDGIADWRPPRQPYASDEAPVGNSQNSQERPREGRLHRTR